MRDTRAINDFITIKLLFVRSHTISGLLIRTALMSAHNHVGIQINHVVYDSSFARGVTRHTLDEFYTRYNVVEELTIRIPDPDNTISFLNEQLGRSYDWKAIVSFPFQRNWHSQKKWMCSELVAEALIQGGVGIPFLSNRVTPRDLLFVVPTCTLVTNRVLLEDENGNRLI